MSTNIQDLKDNITLPGDLSNLIGNFWTGLYDGAGFIVDYLQTLSQTDFQTTSTIEDNASLVSRISPVLYQRQVWYPIKLTQSTLLTNDPLVYNSTDALGTAATSVFNNRVFDYSIPTTLTNAPTIVDHIIKPNIFWTTGLNYVVDVVNSRIRFNVDPFSLDSFSINNIYDNKGNIIDRELTLFIFQADFDLQYLKQQFGYVLGIDLATSINYRDIINSVWDANLLGPSYSNLVTGVAALADAPICLTDGETVQDIATETFRKLVITDKNVYVCNVNAGIVVSVGQKLNLYDQITDAITIVDFSKGTPSPSVMASFTLPASLMNGGFADGLIWNNSNENTVVTTTGSGRTKIEWLLGGVLADNTLFWNIVQANGELAGNKTLAQLMDLRSPPQTTDPDVNSLPRTVNPLDFLVKNIFRNNGVVAIVKQSSCGPNLVTQDKMNAILRLLVPVQSLVFVIYT